MKKDNEKKTAAAVEPAAGKKNRVLAKGGVLSKLFPKTAAKNKKGAKKDSRDEIIELINNASKSRLGMLDTYTSAGTKKTNTYQNKLIELSTVDGSSDQDIFKDIDTKFAEEPYPNLSNGGWGNDQFGKKTTVTDEYYRKQCIALASEIEMREILDKYVDEIIVYENNGKYFCQPSFEGIDSLSMAEAESKKLKGLLQESFEDVYSMLHFDGKVNAADYESVESVVKKWMAIGKYAWYYMFDDVNAPTELTGIRQLDLTKGNLQRYERVIQNEKNLIYWMYTPFVAPMQDNVRLNTNNGHHGHRDKQIILLDSQILQIDWADTDRTSMPYSLVSDLTRSFNIMRTMVRTRISWAIMNSIFRTLHVVPVGGKGKIKAEQTITETMNRYKQKYDFNERTGTFTLNNKQTHRLNYEVWVGETLSGRPETDTVGGDGPDLQDVEQLIYFEKQFHKASGLPLSRFEEDSPTYFNNSPEQISNDERQLGKRIDRIQRIFAAVIEKPWYMHFILKNPQYAGDMEIKKNMSLEFNNYNIYDKMLKMELFEKVASAISGLRQELSVELPDNTTYPFLSMKFLIKKFFPISDKDLLLNDKMLEIEKEEKVKLIADLRAKGLLEKEQEY